MYPFFIYYIIAPFLLLLSPNYEKIFQEGYQDAIHHIQHASAFIAHVFPDEQERALAVSVVFPELMRYSYLEDYFQETVNRVLYVSKGQGGADFSVGRLQMKPSFIEALETYVADRPLPAYQAITRYPSADEKEIRKERMRRLNSSEWQWMYLKVFMEIANDRFGAIDFGRFDKKIRFYATLYNHHFLADKETIIAWSKVEAYPYGVNSVHNQYNYAQVAVYFYLKDWERIAAYFP